MVATTMITTMLARARTSTAAATNSNIVGRIDPRIDA
jgi:hypothetical protein